MVAQLDMLDPFHAIADPTRRALLGRLRRHGALSLSELARDFPMSRQAVSKHLGVLSGAGLVRSWRVGRERMHALEARPLQVVDDWLTPFEAAWDERLERLKVHVDGGEP